MAKPRPDKSKFSAVKTETPPDQNAVGREKSRISSGSNKRGDQRRQGLLDRRDPTIRDKREKELQSAFHRLVDLLAKPVGPDLFQRGIETLQVLLKATYGAVVLTDELGRPKEGIFAGTTPGGSRSLQTFLNQRRVLVDRVLESREPLVITDIPSYLNSISFSLGHPIMHTFIGIPISREQDIFGCIYLCGESDAQQFSDQDQLVVNSFSQALALVLSQARDRAERKRLMQEREILSQLGLKLSAAKTFDKATDVICEVTDKYWQWQTCAISIRRSGNSRFRFLKITSKEESSSSLKAGEFDLSTVPGHDVLLEGSSVSIPSTDLGSRLIAPVKIEADEMALIDITAYPGTDFTDADRNFIQRLADILGPTFARCQAESRNRAFLNLAFKLTSATSAEEAARTIVETADELLGWDSCSVALHHPELGIGQGILHMDVINGVRQDAFSPNAALTPPGPIARKTMLEGPQLILRDPSSAIEPGLGRFGDADRPSLSLMFVPFRVGPQVGGVFSIQSYSPFAYNKKDLQLLQALADYCAGAVERIRLAQGLPDPIDYPDPRLPAPAPEAKRDKPPRPRSRSKKG